MQTMTKIKQANFMKKHGIKPNEIKAIRDQHLAPADWWKEGVVIYWSQDAVEAVEAELFQTAGPQVATRLEPARAIVEQSMEVRVVKLANNPRFVYADLDGIRISVACHPKFSKNIVGKKVRVKVSEIDRQTFYHYDP
jgi:hypothetical protein